MLLQNDRFKFLKDFLKDTQRPLPPWGGVLLYSSGLTTATTPEAGKPLQSPNLK